VNYKPFTKKLHFWKGFVFMNEVHDEIRGRINSGCVCYGVWKLSSPKH
jgi:hypothetical protein